MMRYAKHIAFLLLVIFASGCASSVRFSSNKTCETTQKDEPRATEMPYKGSP